MKKKQQKTLILTLACVCILGTLIQTVSARDSFAPSWLKEGAYAKYTTDRGSAATIFNVSSPEYRGLNCWNAEVYDVLSYSNATLIWRCISTDDSVAKLSVTFDCFVDNAPRQFSGEVYVDLYTRAVYSSDRTLWGTTHLWLPANPAEGQEIVVWDASSEPVTIQVNSITTFETAQGMQDGFMADGTATVEGSPRNFILHCDFDTGLNIGELQWDPIMAALGINIGNLEKFSDTNISLGFQETSFNWTIILQYSILPVAVVLLVTAFMVRRKRRRN